jgi:hypothetical protein
MEVHTTDLMDSCPRRVELRLAGKRIGETPSALMFGQVWHETRAACYAAGVWDEFRASGILLDSWAKCEADNTKNRQPLTEAVKKNATTTQAEISRLLGHYGERVACRAKKLIGCELPIRCSLVVDGEAVEFASHLDVLFRDADGRLTLDDDKTGDEAPSMDYLRRNKQLAMYAYAIRHGTVWVDGEPVEFGEWPIVNWVHVRNLNTYGRKTTVKEVDFVTGELLDRVYEKGEHRPIDRVVMTAPIHERRTPAILADFAQHVRMRRLGLMPANPDKQGCRACESRSFCESYQEEELY